MGQVVENWSDLLRHPGTSLPQYSVFA
ncbi:hypothetical protein NOCA2480117 [metagenome]|uniref:Uncharacterized protein n=1 Tax=metagenome TaxID=256318 RepID=A0A2P2C802_9ZZZZ